MSTDQLRFYGRVAIVTGAGNGLGRQYALDLARLGAKVLVNDLGVSTRGEGRDTSAADKVVAEIRSAGGEAEADYHSVAEGEKVVQTAIDKWGRVDILINNAGILRDVSFGRMSFEDWKLLQSVHLDGAMRCSKAAWPHMRNNKYGRIVMITSAAGLYGNFGQAHYSAVKMGVVGLAQTLALEGAKSNIHVNVVAPIAGSRMTETVMPPELVQGLKPEFVSPMVLFMAHEQCKQNGAIFECGAGWVSKVRFERSAGVFFPLQPPFRIEDVSGKIEAIGDFSQGATYPTSPRDAFPLLMENLERSQQQGGGGAQAGAATGNSTNPNVDVQKALSYKMEPLSHTYTERDVMLYALGIGASADPLDQSELKFTYENHSDFTTLPTYGVVIPSAALNSITSVPGLTFNPMMLLNGEQYTELKKPLPTNATLTSYPAIKALYDKGSGALMVLGVSTKDASGAEVLYNEYSLFIRGLGGFGGDKGPKQPSYEPPANVPPQVVHRERTLDNQALLYRLSGDMNPLHADPDMAKSGNFPAPILHGLCSFGYAARAVLRHFAANDTRLFKSIRARFVSPVFPGETLVTEMWGVEGGRKVLFRVRVAERGVYAIKGGVVELHGGKDAGSQAAGSAPVVATASSTTGGFSSGFQAESVFAALAQQSSPDLVKKINASYKFSIKKGEEMRHWLLDLKSGSGSVKPVDESAKADCTVIISDEDFVQLIAGKLDAQKAFMSGKIKLKGNMMLAQKLQHLPKPSAAASSSSSAAASSPSAGSTNSPTAPRTGFAAEAVFAALANQSSPDLVKKIGATYRFEVKKGDAVKSWLLDLKNGSGSVKLAEAGDKADCTVLISDEDFVKLMEGKLNAQQAFMKGQIKLKGNMMLAQKLQHLQPPKAKL